MSEPLIIKVQRPFRTQERVPSWYFYDARKLREVFVAEDVVDARIKALMGAGFKIYIYASYNSATKSYDFLAEAPKQPW